jgi:hypothetical protein
MRHLRGLAAILAATAALSAAPGWAHGVKSTHAHPGGPDLSWLSLISPAGAAVTVRIDTQGGYRFISSDGLPDHDTGAFPNRNNPNRIAPQNHRFRVPLTPLRAGRLTPLRRSSNFGVAVNGVPFDPFTAENWNNDPRSGWSIEAMGGALNLGLDRHNAHVQPDGSYHYHALPVGVVERLTQRETPLLIGYAADGFPIYAPAGYRDANAAQGALIELRSSWRLKSGTRPNTGERGGPGGAYNGYYTQDWEYAAGSGDLDECNGRSGVTSEYPSGTYYYVITAGFPLIPRCFVGTPDASFDKGPPRGGPGGRPPPGGPGGHPPPR